MIAETGDDDAPPAGVAYQDLPLSACCMFVVDDTRYAQRVCGAPTELGSWCPTHRRLVFVQVSRRVRPRFQATEAVAA